MKTTRQILYRIVAVIAFANFAANVAEGDHYILPCVDECSTAAAGFPG
jgi:hypothetical protein